MIRKLRRRFILVVMAAFLVVIIPLLLGINLVERNRVYGDIDGRLRFLAGSQLGPPEGMLASTPPEIRLWVEQNSTGLMSESSYFILTALMTPNVRAQVFEQLTASLGMDASDTLHAVLAGEDDFGSAGDYRYYVASRGPYKVVFLRCEKEFDSLRALLRASVLLSLGFCAAVFALVMPLAGKVTRPFAANVESQKRFISNAGHALKTPLGVIMSDLDMQRLESGDSEWLQNAQLQADQLARLIDQLTAYSLLDETLTAAPAVPVDLSALGESVAADFRPLALSRGLTLRAAIEPEVMVAGGENAYRTLLSVLMDNAVKYTSEGGAIDLRIRRARRAVIELENTFEDARELELAQLFERFYRAPQHRAAQEGTGLGLSIARDIATLLDGSIQATTGEHSVTFTVELPTKERVS